MLDESREEITRADTKASFLLALYGAVQVVFLTALAAGDWNPSKLGSRLGWLFWLGWLLALAGLYTVGLSVYPRVGNRHQDCIAYFGHVAECETIGEMREALIKSTSRAVSRDEEQLWTISRIVRSKYGHIQHSMWLTLAGLLVCGGSVVAASW